MRKQESITRIGKCIISPSAKIRHGAVIGKPFRKLLDGTQEKISQPTIIDGNTYIGYYALIGGGSKIGTGTIIDDHCVIESFVEIGNGSLLIYRAQICNESQIGDRCVIGGFIAERTIVGNNCRIFGKLIHLQRNPLLGWDDQDATEDSPIVQDNAFIGFDAVVVGGVTIGFNSYVCANATITRDVPDYYIASGTNKIEHFSKWPGERLRSSTFFQHDNE